MWIYDKKHEARMMSLVIIFKGNHVSEQQSERATQ